MEEQKLEGSAKIDIFSVLLGCSGIVMLMLLWFNPIIAVFGSITAFLIGGILSIYNLYHSKKVRGGMGLFINLFGIGILAVLFIFIAATSHYF